MAKKSAPSNQHKNVEVDLEWPRVQAELQNLETKELDQIEATIEKIKKMTWDQIYKTSSKTQKRGLNGEPIEGQQTASGKTIASIRISGKSRARVCRDGNFMKFISIHPDHDSAYDEEGGEGV
ncbi:MAG: hypothetical protein IT288_13865 [Bdellovibrionales bacterium]|nr:hypothetical protein [Bdellovibrionales bacterium]